VFLDHPKRVLDRDQLLDLSQGREADPLDRSIDVQVSRLRKRLGDDPQQPADHQDRAWRGIRAGGAGAKGAERALSTSPNPCQAGRAAALVFGRLLLVLAGGLLVAQLFSAAINAGRARTAW
jgi:hypothetical protein